VRANDRALARMAHFDILCILSWESILRRELKPRRETYGPGCKSQPRRRPAGLARAVAEIARHLHPANSGLTQSGRASAPP
jgi:hypothetical protein